jgi:hypothetical protein
MFPSTLRWDGDLLRDQLAMLVGLSGNIWRHCCGASRGPLNRYHTSELDFAQQAAVADHRIEQPAAFIAGSLDSVLRFVPGVDLIEMMRDRISDLRLLRLVDGAGHWVQQERRAEVNIALLEFLAGLQGCQLLLTIIQPAAASRQECEGHLMRREGRRVCPRRPSLTDSRSSLTRFIATQHLAGSVTVSSIPVRVHCAAQVCFRA